MTKREDEEEDIKAPEEMNDDSETTAATGEETESEKDDVGVEHPPEVDDVETVPPEDGDGYPPQRVRQEQKREGFR